MYTFKVVYPDVKSLKPLFDSDPEPEETESYIFTEPYAVYEPEE